MRICSLFVATILSCAVSGFADDSLTENGKPENKETGRSFAGLHFGVALSITRDTDDNRVEEAVIEVEDEPGLGPTPFVRVKKENNTRARIMLESHYFFTSKKEDTSKSAHKKFGHGPFVAIQPGTDEIIEAIGAGYMIGFQREDAPGQSFNIGLGFVIDPSVKILGDGFTENQAAPLDAQGNPLAVRFQETDQAGIVLLFSFNF